MKTDQSKRKDSIKTGKWTFYKLDHSVLAKGSFFDGMATGKWVYRDYGTRRTFDWDWSNHFQPSTYVWVSDGKVLIKQSCMARPALLSLYENGRKVDEWMW